MKTFLQTKKKALNPLGFKAFLGAARQIRILSGSPCACFVVLFVGYPLDFSDYLHSFYHVFPLRIQEYQSVKAKNKAKF